MVDEENSALHFPCEFPVKILGHANDDFELIALSIVKKHFPKLKQNALKTRESKQGKYLSLTVTVYAESQQQLDALYQELTDSVHVVMAL